MEFIKLPSNSRKLLKELVDTENPTQLLSSQYEQCNGKAKEELRSVIRELSENGLINVKWADNRPWHVILNNSAYTYEEKLEEYERCNNKQSPQSITIGNNNKITDSLISGSVNGDINKTKKNFYEEHPIVCGIFIAVISGLIVALPNWHAVFTFLGGLLHG